MVDFMHMGEAGTAYLLSFGLTCVFQISCFLIAFALKFDKITDLAGCANFIFLAVGTLLLAPTPWNVRQMVLTCLVCASRFQLGAYLLYRVLKRGRDARFDEVREKCAVFLAFWVWQILWVFITSVGIIFVNARGELAAGTPIGPYDIVGWALFVVGFVLQVSSDMIKQNFRSNSANNKKVCDVGPRRYSRCACHPSKFTCALVVSHI